MADLKQKLAEGGLPKEVQDTILEAWNEQKAEIRAEATAEIREEIAVKYEHDREQTVTAMSEMINDVIAEEVQSLKEERSALAKERVRNKEKLSKFMEFAIRKLGTEVVELHEDRKALEENMKKFKEFYLRQADRELTEFRGETKSLAEARVKVLSEGRKKLEEAQKKFVTRAARSAAEWIKESTKKEFNEFRKEINEARQNRFGQRMFESMAEEFRTYFYNEDAHFQELTNAIQEREQKLEEAQAALEDKDSLIAESKKEAKIARDRLIREAKISSSLGHLPRDKRSVMMELLEDVQTERLDESIKRYLPMVLKEGKKPVREKKVLSESEQKAGKRVVTGDRAEKVITESNDRIDEVDGEIDRLVYLGTRS